MAKYEEQAIKIEECESCGQTGVKIQREGACWACSGISGPGRAQGKGKQDKRLTGAIKRFTVPGRPIPKLRERRGRGRRPRTPEKVREYEKLVAWHAAEALGAVGDKPLIESKVFMACHFVFDDKRIGDLTNYVKAIEDALNGKRVDFTRPARLGDRKFKRGDTETIGKVWTDDRHAQCELPLYTFGQDERVDVVIVDVRKLHLLPSVMDAISTLFGVTK